MDATERWTVALGEPTPFEFFLGAETYVPSLEGNNTLSFPGLSGLTHFLK